MKTAGRIRLAVIPPFTLGALLSGGNASSQETDAALEEITVTATRTSDTVNRVPLAETAETQKLLDQQGIRTIADLAAAVPSL